MKFDQAPVDCEIRVVLADDQSLVRRGLRLMVAGKNGIAVVAEGVDLLTALRHVKGRAPHVLLLDLSMPGGSSIEAIRRLRAEAPESKIVVVTMEDNPVFARQAIDAGAVGYVLKDDAEGDLLHVVQLAARGKEYVSPRVAARLDAFHRAVEIDGLSSRETEVVRLIALGFTSSEIAEHLHLSRRTVETHRTHVHGKLGLGKRSELVRYAIERNLIGTDRDAPDPETDRRSQMEARHPTCAHCGKVIGLGEPIVVIGSEGERKTVLVREPELARDQDLLLVHFPQCAPAQWPTESAVSDQAADHRAAAGHEVAADNHERAAKFWEGQGDTQRAGLQREMAAHERLGAEFERRWADLTDPKTAHSRVRTADNLIGHTRRGAKTASGLLTQIANTLERTAGLVEQHAHRHEQAERSDDAERGHHAAGHAREAARRARSQAEQWFTLVGERKT